ncbi:MAG: RNA-binding domain-containing protein [Promethearchaeota archaeon]
MTYQELLEILANPENSKVEFKRDDIRPEQLAKEIVAFCNFRGGQIFLGIDDKTREIVGLSRTNCEEWVMDTVFSRYIAPSIIPIYEEVITPEGKNVAVITVEQGTLKPYVVKENDRETIYIRIGRTSRIASRDQILRMSQESGYYHFEIAPISGSSVNDIDKELFIHFYKTVFGDELKDDKEVELRLSQLDLLVESSFGKKVCSIAGLVLFGKNPGCFLPQHGIRIIHYHGEDIEMNSISDNIFQSPVARIFDNNELKRSGLVDNVIQHLSEKLAQEELGEDKITRVSKWKIPEKILRELVVNSIIHRDYTKKSINEIRLFNDRIEIESSGRLPNTLTIEKIKAGQKYPRNPILIQFAKDLNIMEHKGLGIRKIVLETLRDMGMNEALMEETDEAFKVTIYYTSQK